MNKADLVAELAENLNLNQSDAAAAIEGTLDIIVRAVAAGESVTIMGFGTFEARDRAPRTARNPHTGEPVPVPATHCQLKGFAAASAYASVSQNHASPIRQSTRRFLVRNEAVTILTRLCIQPVRQSSRIPASTSGYPVRPRCQARRSSSGALGHGKESNAGLQFLLAISGKW